MKKKFKFTITMLICAGEGLFSFFSRKQAKTQQTGSEEIEIFCALCSIINLKTSEHDLKPDFQLSGQCQIRLSTSEIKLTVEYNV